MGSRPIVEPRRKPFWLWRSAMSKRKNPRNIAIVSVLTLAVFSAAHSSAATPPSVVSGRERWFRWSSRSGLPPASLSAAAARSGWTRMKSVRSPWRTPVRVLSFYYLAVHPFRSTCLLYNCPTFAVWARFWSSLCPLYCDKVCGRKILSYIFTGKMTVLRLTLPVSLRLTIALLEASDWQTGS